MASWKRAIFACAFSLLACGSSHAQGLNSYPPYYYTTPLPAAPANPTQQAVFWVSTDNLPEQSVLLNGAFSSAPKTVTLTAPLTGFASGSAALEAAILSGSAWTVPAATSMGNTGLTFMLPSTFPQGPFAYELSDSSGWNWVGSANLPTIYFTVGVASSITQATAPLHQVYPNGVETGGLLNIVGRDFPPVSYVAVTMVSGTVIYPENTQNPYALAVLISGSQVTGTGTVQVGASGTIDATYGPPLPLTVYPASTMTSLTVTASNLVGDGFTDNTALIQGDLNSSGALGNSGMAVFLTIPTSGTYMITGSLTIPSHEYLVGGAPAVIISGSVATSGTLPMCWITGSSYCGLINLTLTATMNSAAFAQLIGDGTAYSSSNTGNFGHIVLVNDTISCPFCDGQTKEDSEEIMLQGTDILILDSTFNSPAYSGISVGSDGNAGDSLLWIEYGNGAYICGDTFNLNGDSVNDIQNTQNVFFSNNTVSGLASGTTRWSAAATDPGITLDQGNDCGSIIDGIYIGNSNINNLYGGNGTQAIGWDGGDFDYEGLLAVSSSNSFTTYDTPNFTIHGIKPRNPTDCIVSILAGQGEGQYRFISGTTSGTSFQISQPWSVPPVATTTGTDGSVVVISGRYRHVVIYGNTDTNTMGIEPWGGLQDCEIANNTCINDAGIMLYNQLAYGSYQVMLNADIVNNFVSGSTYFPWNSVWHPAAIRIAPQTESLMSGVLVRGNVGPSYSGSGFLIFTTGEGMCGGTNARLCSFLEEGESAPANSAYLQPLWVQMNDPMVICKENSLMTSQPESFGTSGNNGPTGLYGVEFTVGGRPITVTQLGRWTTEYNQTHSLEITSTTGVPVTGGSASLTTGAGITIGAFNYVALPKPVVLAADSTYFLLSNEITQGPHDGQDVWFPNAIVCPGNGMTINGPVSITASGTTVTAAPNQASDIVNLMFTPEMPLVQNVSTLGPARNNATTSGVNFTVGTMPMIVNQLGRWVSDSGANSQSHLLQLFNAATNAPVPGASVTVNTAGAPVNGFLYGVLSDPVVLPPNTSYYLESAETSGGDDWHDIDGTVVNPGAGAAVNGGEYGSRQAGGVNTSYIPVNLLSMIDLNLQTYGLWQSAYYSAAQITSGSAADTVDFSGDGVPNLLKYTLGFNPITGAGGGLPVVSLPAGSNYLQIAFQRNIMNTDISYIVETSDDLIQWTPIAESADGEVMQNLGGANSVSETTGSIGGMTNIVVQDGQAVGASPRHFIHLKITRP